MGDWQRDGKCWVVTKGAVSPLPLEKSWPESILSQEQCGAVIHGIAWQAGIEPLHVEFSVCFLPARAPRLPLALSLQCHVYFCVFWQVVIHPRMKLKMMLSKLLYVHIFLFMLAQATVHKKA